jgi:TolB-like protein/DNA-binding winged helix-turn-helix (wHTH) protein/Flp pilus assembly protein TadD
MIRRSPRYSGIHRKNTMASGPHNSTDIDFDASFRLGDWLVDPAACRIIGGEGEYKLEPKAMTVLVCLAREPGQVLSRERLEEQAWQGMVVGYDSLASAIIKLRKALGDDSRSPRYIETVPKKGYRLICEVSAAAPEEPVSAPTPVPVTTSNGIAKAEVTSPPAVDAAPRRAWIRFALFALAALIVVAALLYGLFRPLSPPAQEPAIGDRHVIAVLPFRNLSDDVQQDYFSDGITADLITDLSKISGLSVIARNSVFIYKKADVDVRKVRELLGADYVVEGSVRKLGERVRISARLIDAGNGINMWADRFDGTLSNIFAFQDEVTARIIDALAVKLTDRDRTRLAHKYSDSIEAYDEFLRGWQSLWLSSREGMIQARVHFERAIELDEHFARAYANLALTYIYDHLLGWSNDPDTSLRLAHEYADRAISIDDGLPQVYWVKGFADIFSRDYQQAVVHAQHSIELDPSFADGYGLLATVLNYAGKAEQADVEMRKAMKLNPRYPAIYRTIHGEILFNMHDYDGAIENFRLALEANPESEEPRLWLAAALAHTGDLDEANWQLEQIEFSGSKLSLDYIEKVIPLRDPAQRKHLIDGLYKAGLKA